MIFTGDRYTAVMHFINRIKYRFSPHPRLPSVKDRGEVVLPEEGRLTSVELALNSRCTSDYDDNSHRFHWGLFDRQNTLSAVQLDDIRRMVRIPRLTKQNLDIRSENNMFTLAACPSNEKSGIDSLMVESGMQQQALCLLCVALGVGVEFKNLGVNGSILPDNCIGTIQMRLDALKPSYLGSYWTSSVPEGRKPWKRGNLPEPDRRGSRPLLEVVRDVMPEATGERVADRKAIGQLLWAARGRTPHLYKSREWGMTIPTWGGDRILRVCILFLKSIFTGMLTGIKIGLLTL